MMYIKSIENAFLWTTRCKENQKNKYKTYIIWALSFAVGILVGIVICHYVREQIIFNYLTQMQLMMY